MFIYLPLPSIWNLLNVVKIETTMQPILETKTDLSTGPDSL